MITTPLTLISTNNSSGGHHYPKFTEEGTEPLNKWIKATDPVAELGLNFGLFGSINFPSCLATILDCQNNEIRMNGSEMRSVQNGPAE